nr:PKD domain-containing protein [Chitinophaga nivalis]
MISKGAKMQFTVGGKLYKFITVSPQIENGYCSEAMMDQILADVKSRYRVDGNRVYITGISAGGYGTWNYVASGAQYASNIAAIVPVSAAPIDNIKKSGLCNIASGKVAVWNICGDQDQFYQYVATYQNQINSASCNPVIKAISTIIPNAGHNGDTWDVAYDVLHRLSTPNIYEWMLQYSKGGGVPPGPTPPVANAGNNIKLTYPVNSTTLDGAGSKAATGNTITQYQWTYVSGPAYVLSAANTVRARLTGLVAGTYVFELKVTDNNNLSATSRVTVTVAPAATGGCNNCKFLITPSPSDGGAYIDGKNMGVKPGDTICIKAGNYTFIQFFNFTGSAQRPLVFINCGGQVKAGNGGNYGIIFNNVKYFKITGSGSADKYGFKVNGVNKYLNVGLAMGAGCTDYEADRFEITHTEAGVLAKINPTCDPLTQYPNFSIRNVNFHDLYIHGTLGEGMYIGNTASSGTTVDGCASGSIDVIPPRIYNLKIYNVITDGTGWDGIQVASAPENVEIYDNRVLNYGIENKGSQQAGIILGGASNGKVYNNTVIKGTGNGIEVFGMGLCKIYNNVLVNTGLDGTSEGQDALFIDDRPTPKAYTPLIVQVMNNTIVNSGRDGIRLLNTYTTIGRGNIIANNLVVRSGPRGASTGISVQSGIDCRLLTNTWLKDEATTKFQNAAGNDYHLLATSPAIDKGTDLSSYGVTNDQDGKSRPFNNIFDAGAFEYGNSVPVNKPPVADAGQDETITLPVNTVQLDGASSLDPDGSITAYKWTQVSGPGTAAIANTAAAKTAANGLVAGTYVFELEVTDNAGATDTARITVTVKPAAPVNKPPVAQAGSNVTITLPVSSVQLDGSGSSDPDGTITEYLWSQLSGPNTADIASPAGVSTAVNSLIAGTYVFELQVKDNDNATGTARVTVTVKPPVNKPPVANAGNNVTITLPVNTTQLDGSRSADPDGTIDVYKWTQVSGPNTAAIGTPATAQTTVSGLVAGTYVFELEVTDNSQATAKGRVTVTVKPAANKPPVAAAGNDLAITLPVSSVQLDGSASADPDGTITAYEWSQISGPGTAVIVAATGVSTAVNGLTAGTYVFELQVTDNNNATATDRITVTVNPALPGNKPPVANAGSNITLTLPDNATRLDGSTSTDPDGTIVSYQWSQVSGPGKAVIADITGVGTAVSGLTAGIYVFELQIKDNDGASAYARVTVIVNRAANKSPVANAGADIAITLPVSSAQLDGRASTDPDGTITAYQWSQVAGPNTAAITTAASAQTKVTGLIAGTYIFELQVTDNEQASATARVTVTVNPPDPGNQPPIANAGNDVTVELPVSSVTLDGTASYDPDGTIVSYAWTKVSGPGKVTINNAFTATATVSGLVSGTYTFQLQVTDNKGATAQASVTVTVIKPKPDNKPPIANAGNSVTVPLSDDLLLLNGGASYDPDGAIVKYQWTLVSGPDVFITNAGGAKAFVSFKVVGAYEFQLTVTDNDNATANARVTVNVIARDVHENDLQIVPNPAGRMIRLILSDALSVNQLQLYIYHISGRLVKNMYIGNPREWQQGIDISELAGGMYVLKATDGKNLNVVKKFIKANQ